MFLIDCQRNNFQDRYILYKLPVVISGRGRCQHLSSYAGSMLKTARQIPRTGTSSTNCYSLPADWPDAKIEFLCRLNVEDREADSQDRYVVYKLPIAISGQGRCQY